MAFGNTAKSFVINKGTKLVGGLKPDKVEVDKTASKASGMEMAKQKGKFGSPIN